MYDDLHILYAAEDPLLTLENVKQATEGMKNWYRFGWWLDVPLSRRNDIKKNYSTVDEQREALLQEWLEHHPAPSWKLLAWALLRRREPPEHQMLKKLYENYIPGMHIIQWPCWSCYVLGDFTIPIRNVEISQLLLWT